MLSKVAVVSLLAGVVVAQSAIPSGISSQCATFLGTLNTDSSLASCTSQMMATVSSFDASSATSDSMSQTLSSFCSASPSCSEQTVRASLSSFYDACYSDLRGSNAELIALYESIYALIPFQEVLCSRGDDGSFCATSAGSSSSDDATIPLASGGSMAAQEVLDNMGSSAPNATTFGDTNMLFLFLTPSLPDSQLCTSCTRNIMSSYISFESSTPFGPGFSNAILFKGQSALYSAIQDTCGPSFLEGTLQAAGSLSDSGTANLNGAGHAKALSGGLATLAAAGAISLALF